MRVRVLFFGVVKDLAGQVSDSLDLAEGACVNDVLAHYALQIPGLKQSIPSLAVAVNQEYAGFDTKLTAGDEIALLPPVSGGLANAAIVHEPIVTAKILANIKHAEDGALVVFEGIVRNHSRGRPTLWLDYEAYEEMAFKQMEALARQSLSRFSIRDAALIHRLGKLEIGETSVLIVVASAHRAAAFDACRWLIDTLKRTVPIWKKEFFAGGAVWAEGEQPAQEAISRPDESTHK